MRRVKSVRRAAVLVFAVLLVAPGCATALELVDAATTPRREDPLSIETDRVRCPPGSWWEMSRMR